MAIDKLSANAFATGAVANSLGYTPVNKAGDTFTGNVVFSANATITGAATFSNTITVANTITFADSTAMSSSPVGFKNKIINGAFDIWQRGTSGSTTDGYASADRWRMARVTLAQQTITPGSLAWTTSTYYANFSCTSQSFAYIGQRIENVQLLAGQTITLSYWAKSSTSTYLYYNFGMSSGTGGTSITNSNWVPYTSGQQLTTSWAKYTFTTTVPSVSGATLGPNNTSFTEFGFYVSTSSAVTASVDMADVQIEVGSIATPFERRPASLELMMCQRYCELQGNVSSFYISPGAGYSSRYLGYVPYKVTKRVAATTTTYGVGGYPNASGSMDIDGVGSSSVSVTAFDTCGFRVSGMPSPYSGQGGYKAEAEL